MSDNTTAIFARYRAKNIEQRKAQEQHKILRYFAKQLSIVTKSLDLATGFQLARAMVGIRMGNRNVLMQQIRFINIIKMASINLGLLAMPSIKGLALTPAQVKLFLLLVQRKISYIMFLFNEMKRHNEMAMLRNNNIASRTIVQNISRPIALEIRLCQEKINKTKESSKKSWATYWRQKIVNQKFEIQSSRALGRDLWNSSNAAIS